MPEIQKYLGELITAFIQANLCKFYLVKK